MMHDKLPVTKTAVHEKKQLPVRTNTIKTENVAFIYTVAEKRQKVLSKAVMISE